MSNIVHSLRKHQRIFVIGVALAVVTLYMVPLDQLASAGPRADAFKARLQTVIDRLNGLGLTSQADHLTDVQYRVGSILESHGL